MEWKQLLNPSRARTTTLPTDHRQEFERDYDRAVFSTPLKRLQDKAQVFPLEQHDAIRTRLTHSLEVSAVARGLAILVSRWLHGEHIIDLEEGRSIEAIATTCGLIHDLGNPPFGHAGEYAIQEWFKTKFEIELLKNRFGGDEQLVQDFLQFEGNAQTLRLVSKLQILVDYHGLNLTFGTLSALLKYVSPSHQLVEGDSTRKKPGFFASENELVKQIQDTTGTARARNPITFLVEAADDIVYSVADVEDGVKKGVILWDEIDEILKTNCLAADLDAVMQNKSKILKADRDVEPANLDDDIHGAAFRVAAIRLLVGQAFNSFKSKYDDIMEGSYLGELVTEGEQEQNGKFPLIHVLKKIGTDTIYCTSSTLKLELMGREVIKDLLTLFWEGAELLDKSGEPKKKKSFPGKIAALLSPNYRKVFAQSLVDQPDLPEDYHRFQLVTDYVCGMTDSFAKRLHSELMNG